MTIWYGTPSLEAMNERSRNSLAETLGIRFTEIGDDYLTGTMPVDNRTRQPRGYLHGGASVALAETVGSFAAALCVDIDNKILFG
ncbi:MAG: hotdog fold thioesterase, partial [Gammaproteobacteria bacterium]